MDCNWILFRALKMTITNNNCGDQGQDVDMSYTDTTTKQVLTEDKGQLKEFRKECIMVEKMNGR
jgi:hypothetical protein